MLSVHFCSETEAHFLVQVRGMFKCVVRFLAVLPAEVECFRSPTGSYRMRITLEDPTARIHALLQSGDAVGLVSFLML